MNLVFVELFARATAACSGDFNRLFVPFRCIASDVYNKKPLIMRRGDLGDAVRASMSFPFVFKPIEIDSVLAYDGGIYNNFPTDIMREDFKPEVIIGSVVAANPGKPKENDLMSQLENMIMQKINFSTCSVISAVQNIFSFPGSATFIEKMKHPYPAGTVQIPASAGLRWHAI